MTRVDVHCWIGGYPWRHVPHPEPSVLRRVIEREGVAEAWVGHLPSAWWRDPAHGNAELVETLKPFASDLRAVPTVRPDWPHWTNQIDAALRAGSPAVRAYPMQVGLSADHPALLDLGHACAAAGLVLILTTRFEDARQRHLLDSAPDLTAAHVRALARGTAAHLIVAAPSRALVEEVHWGCSPAERARLWWDISWLWGPPDDDFAHLIRTIGAGRLVFGTGWPLRLMQVPRASIDLLPVDLIGAELASGGEIERRAKGAATR